MVNLVDYIIQLINCCFRTILSNENSEVSHNFLQSLIVLNNWHDEMYSDVLRPYFNKTVKIDDHSLKTLIVLFNTRGFCNVSFNRTVNITCDKIFVLILSLYNINFYCYRTCYYFLIGYYQLRCKMNYYLLSYIQKLTPIFYQKWLI